MENFFQTMGGDPRNFNKLDLYKLPSPCFVIDKRALIDNLKVLHHLKLQTGVKILIALKAFSTPYFGPLISEYLDGCCSSGLYETKLAKKYFKEYEEMPISLSLGYLESDFSTAKSKKFIVDFKDVLSIYGMT